MLRLDLNENPSSPRVTLRRAFSKGFRRCNRYPDARADRLISELSEWWQVAPQRITTGAGASEVLLRTASLASHRDREAVFAWPGFPLYPWLTSSTWGRSVPVPLRGFAQDIDRMVDVVTDQTDLFIICNPHNPTGSMVDPRIVAEVCNVLPSKVLVIVDEAYGEYVQPASSCIPYVDRHPNLLIVRTFSKAFGLAGLRVGYAIGNEDVIERLEAARLPFAVSVVAEEAAVAAIRRRRRMLRNVHASNAARDRLRHDLSQRGVACPASSANFLFIPVSNARAVAAACRDHGVAISVVDDVGVRITIGTAKQCERIGSALLSALGSPACEPNAGVQGVSV